MCPATAGVRRITRSMTKDELMEVVGDIGETGRDAGFMVHGCSQCSKTFYSYLIGGLVGYAE